RTFGAAGSTQEDVRVAPHPQSDGYDGRHRLPARQVAQHQEQRRILRLDEYLIAYRGFSRAVLATADFIDCRGQTCPIASIAPVRPSGSVTGSEQVSPTQTKTCGARAASSFARAGCEVGSASAEPACITMRSSGGRRRAAASSACAPAPCPVTTIS